MNKLVLILSSIVIAMLFLQDIQAQYLLSHNCNSGTGDITVIMQGTQGQTNPSINIGNISATTKILVTVWIESNDCPGNNFVNNLTISNGSQSVTASGINVIQAPSSTYTERLYRATINNPTSSVVSISNMSGCTPASVSIQKVESGANRASYAYAINKEFHFTNQTYNVNIGSATQSRDIRIQVPIHEKSNDGRIARVEAWGNGVPVQSAQITYQNSGNEAGLIVLDISNVPASTTSLNIKIISPTVNGDSFGVGIITTYTKTACTPGCSPLTNAGTISGSNNFCGWLYGTFNLTGTTPSGGYGSNIQYQWQYRLRSPCNTSWGSWTNWVTTKDVVWNYNDNKDHQFRRLSKRQSCGNWVYSNTISVLGSHALNNAGSISGGGTFCGSVGNVTLGNASNASGGCGGTIQYGWDYRTKSACGGSWGAWQVWNGQSGTTANWGGGTLDHQFRRRAKRSTCGNWSYSNVITFDIQSPLSNAGTISGSNNFCGWLYGTFNLTGTTPSGGCGGNIEYRWQYRLRSPCNTSWGSWTNWVTTKDVVWNYNNNQDHQFRRLSRRQGCGNWVYSNTISVLGTHALNNAGSISGGGTFCGSVGNVTLGNAGSASGGCGGTIQYGWDYRTKSACGGSWGAWQVWNGQSGATANWGGGTLDHQFRRRAKRSTCGNWVYSNIITFDIQSPLINAGTISGGGNFCGSISGNQTLSSSSSPSGGCGGSIQYQWEFQTRSTCGSSWSNWSNWTGRTSASATWAANTTLDHQFRRRAKRSTCGNWVYSNVITFDIQSPLINAGTISGGGSFCGSISGNQTLSSSSSPSGGCGGSIQYQWEFQTRSTCGSSWSNWSNWTGRTSASATWAANTTLDHQFRRRAKRSTCGNWVYSNVITFNIFCPTDLDQFTKVNNGSYILGNTVTVCSGDDLILDFGGTFGSNWNFVFKRPDGTNFSGGTNGVDNDQILLPNIQDGSVNEGVWEATYTDPNGCSVTESFTVNINPKTTIIPYIRVNSGAWSNTTTTTLCEGGTFRLGTQGGLQTGIVLTKPDGTTDNTPDGNAYFEITNAATSDAGIYTITYTNSNGCVSTQNYTVNINAKTTIIPYIRINSEAWLNTITTTLCEGGTLRLGTQGGLQSGIVLTLPDGTMDDTPDGNAFFVINNVTTSDAGIYTITYTNPNGCVSTQNYTVTINANPNITSITKVDATCGQNDGSITINFIDNPNRTQIEFSLDGGNTYQAQVLDNSGSVTYNNLAPGTYDLWARWGNDECPINLTNQTISNQGQALGNPGTISGGGTFCISIPNGNITLNSTAGASGGSGTISYQWEYRVRSICGTTWGNWTTWTGQTNVTATFVVGNNNNTLDHQFRRGAIRSNCGSVTYSNIITFDIESPLIDAGIVSGGGTFCGIISGNQTLNSTGIASGGCGSNIEYQWEFRTRSVCSTTWGNWTTWTNRTSASITWVANNTEDHQFRRGTKRSNCGSLIYSNVLTFDVESPFTDGGSISGDETGCDSYDPTNITSTANPSGGCGGSTEYQWQSRTGTSGAWTDISGAISATFDPSTISQTQQYRRGAKRSGCGNFVYSNIITKTVTPNPVIVCEAHPNSSGWITLPTCAITVCIGEQLQLSVNPNVNTVNWTGPNGFTATNVNFIDLGTVAANEAGVYTATLTQNGCTVSEGITVNVRSIPNVTSITKMDESCGQSNGSITFNFTDDPDFSNVEFSLDGGTTYQAQVPDNSGSVTYSNLASGTYDLWVRWGNDQCPIDLGSRTIDANPAPNAGTLTADATPICISGSVTISATPDGNIFVPTDYEVVYVLTSGAGLVIEQAGATSSFTVNAAGDYTIHTLVAETSDNTSPDFFDLSTITFGMTTGFDVNGLLQQGGGSICGSLDVMGAPIIVDPAPVIVCEAHPNSSGWITLPTCAITVCIGESLQLSVNPNVNTVDWTGPNGFTATNVNFIDLETVTANEAGIYTATLMQNGCTVSENITVNVLAVPNITAITKIDATCGQNNGSITFEFTDDPVRSQIEFSLDGGNTYQAQVPDNSGSITYNNLASGTYDLWVRWGNDECPINLSNQTISNQVGLTVSTSADQTICEGENASLMATATGGTAPYTYNWNNGLGTGANQTVSPMTTTNYTITVTDANSCTETAQITVNVLNPPTVDAGIDQTIISGNSANLMATATDGTAPYTYNWNNGLGSGASQTVSPTTNTTYTVTVTDANGCTDTDDVTVNINPCNVTIDAGADQNVCQNDALTITAIPTGGTAPFTYVWNDASNTTAATLNVNTSLSPNPSQVRTFTVTVTDANGCMATDDVTVNIRQQPAFNSITTQDETCGNNDGAITFSYDLNSTETTLEISLDGGGTYPFTVNVDGSSPATNIGTPDAFPCEAGFYQIINGGGASNGQLFIFDVNSNSYVPIGSPSGIITNAIGYNTIDGFIYGIAHTAGLDALGATIAQGDLLKIDSDGEAFRVGNVNTVSYNNGDVNNGYLWLTQGTNIIKVDVLNANTTVSATLSGSIGVDFIIINNNIYSAAGNQLYSVDISNVLNGQTLTRNTYSVSNLPSSGGYGAIWAATNTTTGQKEMYVSNNNTGNIYRIDNYNTSSPTAVQIATGTSTGNNDGASCPNAQAGLFLGQDSYTINNLSAGAYNLRVRWGDGACPVDLPSVTISNQDNLTVDAGNNQTFCLGENHLNVSLSASGSGGTPPYTYTWDNGLGVGQNQTITNLTTTTTYTVTITDANGCTSTDQVTITINDFPDIQFTVTNPSCGVSNGAITFSFPDHPTRSQLEVSFDGGNTYQQQFADNLGTQTYSNRSAGIYPIYARWGNDDCPLFLGTAILENSQGIKAIIEGDNHICPGGSTDLYAQSDNGTAPFSYQWFTDAGSIGTNNFITVNPTTTTRYSVMITDANGCIAYKTIAVQVRPCGEICNNGIDDDGDGLIDCDDSECITDKTGAINKND